MIETLRQNAVRGVKWMTLSTILVVGMQLLQMGVLARVLDPTDFGLMAMLLVVVGFAQCFSDMGLSNIIIYKQKLSPQVLSSLYWACVLSGVVIFLVIIMLAAPVSHLYREPRLIPLLRLIAVIFLIVPFGQPFQSLLQKQLNFKAVTFSEFCGTAAGTTAAIVFALTDRGVYSLVFGQLILAAVRACCLAGMHWRHWRPRCRFSRSDLKGIMSFGQFQMGERTLNFLKGNVDKFLVAKWLGAQSLGFYSLAFQLMLRPVLLLNAVLSKVAFPVLSRVQDDNERLGKGYLEMIRLVSFYCIPLCLWMFVVAEPLIHVLLGSGWEQTITVFKIIVFLGIFIGIGNPLGSLILSKGRADMGFWLNVLGFSANTAAIYIGSKWGLTGMCWSLLFISGILLFPLNFWVCWKLAAIRPSAFLNSFHKSKYRQFQDGGYRK